MDIKWLEAQFPDLKNFAALAPSGQKEVFAAEHRAEGNVVLKIFKPGANAERIKREMEAPLKVRTSRVPHVAQLDRMNSPVGEIVWLREAKIPGQSLKDLLEAKGKLDTSAAIKLALHVTEVLAAAEAAGVVHRDIKPGNIIIDPDGNAWVIDFGLARHLDLESVTATGDKLAACTPGYAPVEQFNNQKRNIDARADLFALGVTLYECIEGENPFLKGTTDWKVILDHVSNDQLPRLARKDVPEEFIEFVDALSRTKAEHRPQMAADALEWIKQIAEAAHIS